MKILYQRGGGAFGRGLIEFMVYDENLRRQLTIAHINDEQSLMDLKINIESRFDERDLSDKIAVRTSEAPWRMEARKGGDTIVFQAAKLTNKPPFSMFLYPEKNTENPITISLAELNNYHIYEILPGGAGGGAAAAAAPAQEPRWQRVQKIVNGIIDGVIASFPEFNERERRSVEQLREVLIKDGQPERPFVAQVKYQIGDVIFSYIRRKIYQIIEAFEKENPELQGKLQARFEIAVENAIKELDVLYELYPSGLRDPDLDEYHSIYRSLSSKLDDISAEIHGRGAAGAAAAAAPVAAAAAGPPGPPEGGEGEPPVPPAPAAPPITFKWLGDDGTEENITINNGMTLEEIYNAISETGGEKYFSGVFVESPPLQFPVVLFQEPTDVRPLPFTAFRMYKRYVATNAPNVENPTIELYNGYTRDSLIGVGAISKNDEIYELNTYQMFSGAYYPLPYEAPQPAAFFGISESSLYELWKNLYKRWFNANNVLLHIDDTNEILNNLSEAQKAQWPNEGPGKTLTNKFKERAVPLLAQPWPSFQAAFDHFNTLATGILDKDGVQTFTTIVPRFLTLAILNYVESNFAAQAGEKQTLDAYRERAQLLPPDKQAAFLAALDASAEQDYNEVLAIVERIYRPPFERNLSTLIIADAAYQAWQPGRTRSALWLQYYDVPLRQEISEYAQGKRAGVLSPLLTLQSLLMAQPALGMIPFADGGALPIGVVTRQRIEAPNSSLVRVDDLIEPPPEAMATEESRRKFVADGKAVIDARATELNRTNMNQATNLLVRILKVKLVDELDAARPAQLGVLGPTAFVRDMLPPDRRPGFLEAQDNMLGENVRPRAVEILRGPQDTIVNRTQETIVALRAEGSPVIMAMVKMRAGVMMPWDVLLKIIEDNRVPPPGIVPEEFPQVYLQQEEPAGLNEAQDRFRDETQGILLAYKGVIEEQIGRVRAAQRGQQSQVIYDEVRRRIGEVLGVAARHTSGELIAILERIEAAAAAERAAAEKAAADRAAAEKAAAEKAAADRAAADRARVAAAPAARRIIPVPAMPVIDPRVAADEHVRAAKLVFEQARDRKVEADGALKIGPRNLIEAKEGYRLLHELPEELREVLPEESLTSFPPNIFKYVKNEIVEQAERLLRGELGGGGRGSKRRQRGGQRNFNYDAVFDVQNIDKIFVIQERLRRPIFNATLQTIRDKAEKTDVENYLILHDNERVSEEEAQNGTAAQPTTYPTSSNDDTKQCVICASSGDHDNPVYRWHYHTIDRSEQERYDALNARLRRLTELMAEKRARSNAIPEQVQKKEGEIQEKAGAIKIINDQIEELLGQSPVPRGRIRAKQDERAPLIQQMEVLQKQKNELEEEKRVIDGEGAAVAAAAIPDESMNLPQLRAQWNLQQNELGKFGQNVSDILENKDYIHAKCMLDFYKDKIQNPTIPCFYKHHCLREILPYQIWRIIRSATKNQVANDILDEIVFIPPAIVGEVLHTRIENIIKRQIGDIFNADELEDFKKRAKETANSRGGSRPVNVLGNKSLLNTARYNNFVGRTPGLTDQFKKLLGTKRKIIVNPLVEEENRLRRAEQQRLEGNVLEADAAFQVARGGLESVVADALRVLNAQDAFARARAEAEARHKAALADRERRIEEEFNERKKPLARWRKAKAQYDKYIGVGVVGPVAEPSTNFSIHLGADPKDSTLCCPFCGGGLGIGDNQNCNFVDFKSEAGHSCTGRVPGFERAQVLNTGDSICVICTGPSFFAGLHAHVQLITHQAVGQGEYTFGAKTGDPSPAFDTTCKRGQGGGTLERTARLLAYRDLAQEAIATYLGSGRDPSEPGEPFTLSFRLMALQADRYAKVVRAFLGFQGYREVDNADIVSRARAAYQSNRWATPVMPVAPAEVTRESIEARYPMPVLEEIAAPNLRRAAPMVIAAGAAPGVLIDPMFRGLTEDLVGIQWGLTEDKYMDLRILQRRLRAREDPRVIFGGVGPNALQLWDFLSGDPPTRKVWFSHSTNWGPSHVPRLLKPAPELFDILWQYQSLHVRPRGAAGGAGRPPAEGAAAGAGPVRPRLLPAGWQPIRRGPARGAAGGAPRAEAAVVAEAPAARAAAGGIAGGRFADVFGGAAGGAPVGFGLEDLRAGIAPGIRPAAAPPAAAPPAAAPAAPAIPVALMNQINPILNERLARVGDAAVRGRIRSQLIAFVTGMIRRGRANEDIVEAFRKVSQEPDERLNIEQQRIPEEAAGIGILRRLGQLVGIGRPPVAQLPANAEAAAPAALVAAPARAAAAPAARPGRPGRAANGRQLLVEPERAGGGGGLLNLLRIGGKRRTMRSGKHVRKGTTRHHR